jgi:hypothetical protein
MKEAETVTVGFECPRELVDKLREAAKREMISKSAFLRRAAARLRAAVSVMRVAALMRCPDKSPARRYNGGSGRSESCARSATPVKTGARFQGWSTWPFSVISGPTTVSTIWLRPLRSAACILSAIAVGSGSCFTQSRASR